MSAAWLTQARAEGLITADTTLATARPWPVVLLTGLAAWLAVPPLCLALYLLFGAAWSQGPMDYAVGLLLVGLAIVLLRGRGRALFLEQLGVPLLLTGLLSLGHGLDRDMTDLQAEAVGLLITAGLIVALPASWLRTLLGAGAAVLTTLLLWQMAHTHESPRELWALAHATGLVALLMMAVQYRAGRNGREASLAAVLEPVLAGWWVVVLGLLVWSAGPTFLVAVGLAELIRAGAPHHGVVGDGVDWVGLGIAAASAALALAGAAFLQRAWQAAQPWRLVPPVLVLAALATQMPALGACLFLLTLMLATRRWRLAVLAGAAVLWVLGSFYYSLQWPLQQKALMLIGGGALLAAWARWMASPLLPAAADDGEEEVAIGVESASMPLDAALRGTPWDAVADRAARDATVGAAVGVAGHSAEQRAGGRIDGGVDVGVEGGVVARRAVAWLVGFGVLAVVVVNLLIVQKEQLITEGRPVFVRLGPVDPRSLMQGDYMRLSYTLPGVGWIGTDDSPMLGRRPVLAVRVDERGIVQSPRLLKPDEAVPAGMVPLQLAPTGSGWTFVTDAWYFREGDGQRWAPARYGEFRLLPDGRALLVNLVGEDLKPL